MLGNQFRIGKTQASLQSRFVPDRIGLLLVKRTAAHVQIQPDARRIEPDEVRGNHDQMLTASHGFGNVFDTLKTHHCGYLFAGTAP